MKIMKSLQASTAFCWRSRAGCVFCMLVHVPHRLAHSLRFPRRRVSSNSCKPLFQVLPRWETLRGKQSYGPKITHLWKLLRPSVLSCVFSFSRFIVCSAVTEDYQTFNCPLATIWQSIEQRTSLNTYFTSIWFQQKKKKTISRVWLLIENNDELVKLKIQCLPPSALRSALKNTLSSRSYRKRKGGGAEKSWLLFFIPKAG